MERYGYPALKDYLANEIATFSFLRSQTSMCRYPEFVSALGSVYSKLRSNSAQNIDLSFRFTSLLDEKSHDVNLSMVIRFDRQRMIYSSFAIEIFGADDLKEKNEIIRRIHFDVAFIGVDHNKADHPLYHLQVGGVGSLKQRRDYEIRHLSFPRILFYPLSFALFFDMAIREVGTKELKMVVDGGGWRKIVRASEDLMIYPYFENIIGRKQKSASFILPDVYYESGDEA